VKKMEYNHWAAKSKKAVSGSRSLLFKNSEPPIS